MILEQTISNVYLQQKEYVTYKKDSIERDKSLPFQSIDSHAIIVSGVRRCGKSTLLLQLIKQLKKESIFYLNFDTPLLFGFSITDFSRLDNIIKEQKSEWLFFDEIQVVEGWEIYVRQKLDEHFKVIVTGSNASLLSKELGTKLTGRHIPFELYPFSYSEFLRYKKAAADKSTAEQYLVSGGFPEYVRTNDENMLTTMFQDIIYRDIVARYGIKEITALQRLSLFLSQNIGNRFTAGKLKQSLSVGSTGTILNWCNYLENSYLFSFVEKFSYSVRSQMVNAKKIYAVDTGLIHALNLKSTLDMGHLLENAVFLHFKNLGFNLNYFEESNECDFILFKNGKPIEATQVCYELNPDNQQREINGVVEAMQYFNFSEGTIITINQIDKIVMKDKTIYVKPFWKL